MDTFRINDAHTSILMFLSVSLACGEVSNIGHLVSLYRCILVDEKDTVIGHDSKYNCKWSLSSKSIENISIYIYYILSHE